MGTGECEKAIRQVTKGLECFLLLWVVESSQKFLSRTVRLGLSEGQQPEPLSLRWERRVVGGEGVP